ncbi:hypothetical protein BKA64DRAFT_375114 [Cadophora sp. MPI-SDFR-AT-0126]|nr:hypothetical protein BKA64DRAFT_375114 [Leotiomycetes sp. MPI-SDFR-AT-0126]
MLYNAAILSVLAASTSMISVSVAAPVNARTPLPAPSCPAGTSYVDYESTSGFKGCTATPSEYQYGPRKYWSSCPIGHGNWYVCASGFKGCTTDSTICDPKPSGWVPPVIPPVEPTTCPTGQNYYVCATGFKGCSADTTVCDPKPKDPEPIEPGSCASGQQYYVCANGFKGCSSDTTVCDTKNPEPEVVYPSTGNSKFCPAGTSYYDYESTSGFKGCTSSPAPYQTAPRVYWGSCPTGHGNWYVCANGFKGCNTNSAVCDLKA